MAKEVKAQKEQILVANNPMTEISDEGYRQEVSRNRDLKPRAWAVVQYLFCNSTVKVDNEDRAFFTSKDYKLILLTNNVIKIQKKGKKEAKITYVPLHNVKYFTLDEEDDIA